MLEKGLFSQVSPSPIWPSAPASSIRTLPTGRVGYRAGYAQANVDSVDIIVRGRGGHGAPSCT